MKDANGVEVTEGDWIQIDAKCGVVIGQLGEFKLVEAFKSCDAHGDSEYILGVEDIDHEETLTFRKIELLPAMTLQLPSFERSDEETVTFTAHYPRSISSECYIAHSLNDAQKFADAWQQVADHWEEYVK